MERKTPTTKGKMSTSANGQVKDGLYRRNQRRTSSSVPSGATVTQCSTDDIVELVSSTYPKEKELALEGEKNQPAGQCPSPNQNMKGFDIMFVDIVDYTLRVTQWIWNTKDDYYSHKMQRSSPSLSARLPDLSHVSKLCEQYYSKNCTLHTLSEDFVGRQSIVTEFEESLKVFPDQVWYGENVIWSLEDEQEEESSAKLQKQSTSLCSDVSPTYYTSQLVVSHMTQKGSSSKESFKQLFGLHEKQPTHKHARQVMSVVDSICTENQIVEQWMMRDNSCILKHLGMNARRVAIDYARYEYKQSQKNQKPINPQIHIIDRLEQEIQRVQKQNILSSKNNPKKKENDKQIPLRPSMDPKAYAVLLMNVLWGKEKSKQSATKTTTTTTTVTIEDMYDSRVRGHFPGGREIYGHSELKDYFIKYLQEGLSEISVSIDHVACVPYMPGSSSSSSKSSTVGGAAADIAVRWTLVGVHSGRHRLLGMKPSHRPVYILASSHFRLVNGHKIREEWTVFDEVALVRQAELQRLIREGGTGDGFSTFLDRTIFVLILAVGIFFKLRLMDGFVLSEYLEIK